MAQLYSTSMMGNTNSKIVLINFGKEFFLGVLNYLRCTYGYLCQSTKTKGIVLTMNRSVHLLPWIILNRQYVENFATPLLLS